MSLAGCARALTIKDHLTSEQQVRVQESNKCKEVSPIILVWRARENPGYIECWLFVPIETSGIIGLAPLVAACRGVWLSLVLIEVGDVSGGEVVGSVLEF